MLVRNLPNRHTSIQHPPVKLKLIPHSLNTRVPTRRLHEYGVHVLFLLLFCTEQKCVGLNNVEFLFCFSKCQHNFVPSIRITIRGKRSRRQLACTRSSRLPRKLKNVLLRCPLAWLLVQPRKTKSRIRLPRPLPVIPLKDGPSHLILPPLS